jgi:pyrimidine deaminase RibD-like protein
MHYPRTFVIGLEADSHIIPSPTCADDITSNRVHKVVGCIPCTSNNSEIMLKNIVS